MEEELRKAFSKKEKIELFISKLNKLKEEGSIEEAHYRDLKAEYDLLLEEAISSVKEIKTRMRKAFDKKAFELENLQKEYDLLQARLNVGEIRFAQTKQIKNSIDQSKKEVLRFRTHVNATSTAEIGGPVRVEIPELKVKKIRSKPKTPAPEKVEEPQKEVVKKKEVSVPSAKHTVEDLDAGKRSSVTPASKRNDRMVVMVIGIAVVIVVIIFAVGRLVSTSGDHNPPVISGVVASATGASSATIEWATNENATSQVILKDAAGAGITSPADKNLVTKHSVTISGIKPNVKYQITVKSSDASGNELEYKTEQAFTAVAASPYAPVISSLSVLDISDIGAVITWKTDKPMTSQVTLTEQGAKSPLLFTPKMELTTNHAVIVNNLKPGTTYTFTLTSKDASGIESHFDSGQSFTTIAALPTGPEIGKMAPDFTLLTTEGKSLTLSSYRGKLVLLNFWQRGCPACVREMPMMQAFFAKLSTDQIIIIGVNVREDEATVKAFKERWSLTFPILLDPTGQISRSYVIDDIPASFFVNGQGVIKEIKIGPFDSAEEIESIINSLGKSTTTK